MKAGWLVSRKIFACSMSRQRTNARHSNRPPTTRSNWWTTCVGSSRASRKKRGVCRPRLAEVDQVVFRQSEELAAVDSHLRALQGVLPRRYGLWAAR